VVALLGNHRIRHVVDALCVVREPSMPPKLRSFGPTLKQDRATFRVPDDAQGVDNSGICKTDYRPLAATVLTSPRNRISSDAAPTITSIGAFSVTSFIPSFRNAS
jgi:hypothetical protein